STNSLQTFQSSSLIRKLLRPSSKVVLTTPRRNLLFAWCSLCAPSQKLFLANRGHDSITVFRVHFTHGHKGLLSTCLTQHTRGATPRHFQFDASGQWLITANQDSDNISVFRFNLATGKLEFTGNEYEVPSPNFVCNMIPHRPAGLSTL
ncbi:unnamed protein product, partial [Durusdinium trenchii]